MKMLHRIRNPHAMRMWRGFVVVIALALVSAGTASAAAGEWTWVGGPNTTNGSVVYGTKTVADPANRPGGLSFPITWQAASNTFWMFGGATTTGLQSNALWRYDGANWTWMSGSSSLSATGVYGTQGTPDAANVPGARIGSATWKDPAGNLWLFGGWRFSGTAYFNDLWKFDVTTNQWTWMGGSSGTNQHGTYGVKGAPDPANVPGARSNPTFWTDAGGNFWLFGGFGYANSGVTSVGSLQDLWKYDVTTNQWTWVGGTDTINQLGVYGVKGTPDPANIPGARGMTVSWVDASGDLWLFGGMGYDGSTSTTTGDLNDLWKYDISSGQWTWMSGFSTLNYPPNHGTFRVPDPANHPGARDGAVGWIGPDDSLWLFGGSCCGAGFPNLQSDLWRYDINTGMWAWMSGRQTSNEPGAYGTQGTSAPNTTPGGRFAAGSFKDASGDFWLFGGQGYASTTTSGTLSDLWKFEPVPSLPPPPPLPDPIPPDLVIDTLSGPVSYESTNPPMRTDLTFKVTVRNQGGLDTAAASAVRLYYTTAPLAEPVTIDSLAANPAAHLFGEATLPAGLADGSVSTPVSFTGQLPTSGTYYLYAAADAQGNIDEAGIGLTTYDPAREANNVSAPRDVIVSGAADLALTMSVNNPAAATGDVTVYSIFVQNLGPTAAYNIQLVDVLPAGVTYQSASTTSGATTLSGASLTWSIPQLAAHQVATLNITVRVTASPGTVIVNQVTSLTMDPGNVDLDPSNDMSCPAGACRSATITVGALNLGLTKTVNNVNPATGSAVTYTLTAHNYSVATPATNARIVDTLPAGVTYSTSTPPGGGACAVSGQTVTCNLGAIAASGSATATITVTVNAGVGGQIITNTATVSATEFDPIPVNNTASVSVLVQSIDIQVTQTVRPLYAPTGPGNPFTWTVTVRNLGPNDAPNVVIQDTPPTAALNTAPPPVFTVSSGSWNAATSRWTIPSLAVGASATLTITATARTNQDGQTLTNTASFVSAGQTDVNPANNSASSAVHITTADEADLQVVETVSPSGSVAIGSTVTYTWIVTNNGPRPVSSVVLSDPTLAVNTSTTMNNFFQYLSAPPAGWNTTTGKWTSFPLSPGASKTYTMTLVVNDSILAPSFTDASSVTSERADQDMTNNTASTTITVPIQGPNLWPEPLTHDFGDQVAGTSSDPFTYTLTNVGSANFRPVSISQDGSSSFSVSGNTCRGQTIPPGGTCTVSVVFSPAGVGVLSGSVTLTNTPQPVPRTIYFTGTGTRPAVSISPETYDFGEQLAGTSSDPASYTLTNSGTADLHTGALSQTGSSDFALGNNTCDNQTIPPGGTCSFAVTFSPSAVGTRSGVASIPSDAPGSPHAVTFTGMDAEHPVLSLSEDAVNFGEQRVGTPSDPLTFTVTNTGNADLHVEPLNLDGSTDFAVSSDTCSGATIAAGETCSFDVIYTPTTAGDASGSISIASDAPESPRSVSLAGTGTQPEVTLEPVSNDFGGQAAGTSSAPVTFTVTNSGTAELHIGTLSQTGSADFALSNNTCDDQILGQGGGACTFDVTFTPSAAGAVSGAVSIPSDAPGSPHSVSFSGTGLAPEVSLSAASHDFGEQLVTTSSAPFTFTVTNSGNIDLNVGTVTRAGSPFFALSNNTCDGATLAPEGTCAFDVTFTPYSHATAAGSISIPSDAPGSPASISLSGVGVMPVASLSATSHAFGDVLVGTSSDPFTFTVTNTGDADMHPESVSGGGTTFTISGDTCSGATVAPGGICSFDVTFNPPSATPYPRPVTITFKPGPPLPAQPIIVSGRGVQPELRLSDSGYDFGGQLVGTSSDPYTITATNSGNADLHMGTISLTGSDAFVIGGDTCSGATIAPSGTCSFDVTFSPTAAGDASGEVSIPSDAPSSPDSVGFSGTGLKPEASLSATSHDFGDQLVGTSGAPVTITLTSSGVGDLHIGAFGQTGSDGFVLSGNACENQTIIQGETCSFDVTFTPTSAGAAAGQISIPSDAPDGPAVVQLSGTGTQPALDLAPASHDFGDVVIGSTSSPFSFTVTNSGSADLHVSGASASGSFAVSGTTCLSAPVAPGGTCSIAVIFSPPAEGAAAGALTIDSDAPSSPASADLSGTGILPPPPALSSPGDGAVSYQTAVTLAWENQGAAEYEVRLSDVTFAARPVEQTIDGLTAANTALTLPYGVYRWQVRSRVNGFWSEFSAARTFEVTLNRTPANGAVVNTLRPRFTWQRVAGASYLIELYTDPADPDGSTVFAPQAANRPSYTIPAALRLARGTTYYWRVSIDGGLTWTPGWMFSTR